MTNPVFKNRCELTAVFFCFKSLSITAFLTVVLCFLQGCKQPLDKLLWHGETMGTYYRITLVQGDEVLDETLLRAWLELELWRLSSIFSTYLDDSEVSQFNQLESNSCLKVSNDFITVLAATLALNHQSNGAFNPLVGRLVERWGFGRERDVFEFPSDGEIELLKSLTAVTQLSFDYDTKTVCKSNKEVYLDFSAIAKGYAVDRLSQLLSDNGVSNHLVDIGGELKALGENANHTNWRVAVELPDTDYAVANTIIGLSNVGVATSGDYRNFFVHDGGRYSHTIDPATGYPIDHNLASVTVVSSSTMLADGWATAMSVLGFEKGKALALKLNLAVYLLERENVRELVSGEGDPLKQKMFVESSGSKDTFREWYSPEFTKYMN